MAEIPAPAVAHAERIRRLRIRGVSTARRAWRRVEPARISESWTEQLPELERQMRTVNVQAATRSLSYAADTLAAQGDIAPAEAFGNPAAWGTPHAPDGRRMASMLYSPATTAKAAIAAGFPTAVALKRGRDALTMLVMTMVADVARQAASVDLTVRADVGWVRMTQPGACSRCLILAGRWYRWNDGFLRHPRCSCVHVMAKGSDLDSARDRGLVDDPYEYFRSLTEAEQNRLMGLADAQAVRDGADIFQVVNSRRSRNGLTTAEGTTRRGYAGQLGAARGQRLTPEGIYRRAGGNRDIALNLLERNGYILPGGQDPAGVLRGSREGWGALGRGGTRVGARGEIERARASGVRAPRSRYTMTEAERRLTDSRLRWDAVRQGRNPYSRDGAGLTPKIAAQVENDYRRWLATGGQIFTA